MLLPGLQQSDSASHRSNLHLLADQQAREWYRRACAKGRLRALWAALTRRPYRLLDLAALRHHADVRGQHALGLQSVPVRQIQGSEGRLHDFDRGFAPLQERTRERWLSIAAASQRGYSLPPVELIMAGEVYFVRDGHHRVSVARASGAEEIDAVVTRWLVAGPLPWEQAQPCAAAPLPAEH